MPENQCAGMHPRGHPSSSQGELARGLEPLTSALQVRSAANCATPAGCGYHATGSAEVGRNRFALVTTSDKPVVGR